jgi:phenylpyruvate tautomerase
MPMIRLATNAEIDDARRGDLLSDLSKLIAEAIGKPERYVMAAVQTEAILMSGQAGPSAFAEVRSIGGLDGEVNQKITAALCSLLHERLAIPADRVYVNFFDMPAGNWGWNGQTFG